MGLRINVNKIEETRLLIANQTCLDIGRIIDRAGEYI